MRTSKANSITTLSLALAAMLALPSPEARAEGEETEGSNTPEPTVSTAASADAEASQEGKETADAQDGDEKRKLSDRIKSVQRKEFLKKNRIEIFPHFGLDLNDPFFQHFIVGASVGYHLVDSFSVEARGGFAIGSVKQSAIRFVRTETDSLLENPPEFKYHADLDFVWAPLYGKLSLFSEAILHFDTYVTAGPGIFGTDAGLNPAANVGIGQRYFITDWLVARIELRNYLFLDNRNNESDLQNLMILGFAVSGFFPMSFAYEFE